ncbi:Bifunctional apoptosis regulator [Labeo rohita]|uniref:Bifunctional apoptosis regulator n=2 Tax=Labeonini TaxID=2743697 RepID=A0ABQ8L4C7_LABRO|nr:bifunctional apoptosis regulator [Labeo rohita]KAI2645194.1 Bifunctional apoptosis regulator [Labeo rohita]
MYKGKMTDECITIESALSELDEDTEELSAPEFTCHCCYEVLVDPTTLNCGHSFCRHCLAQWLHSSQRNECPECRERWQGFPRINILLRDAVEKKYPTEIKRRRRALQTNPRIHYFLQMFQQYGEMLTQQIPVSEGLQKAIQNSICFGVMMALVCMGVLLIQYHWISGNSNYDILVQKPINSWKPHDVILWVEHLGRWTIQYREMFHIAQINGSLLAHLRDEELSAAPFKINNPSHRQVILEEIQKIKELKVKLPQNIWEYKATNLGKSLFLLFGLREFPRLTFLYLYLFDYEDTFLPFIHTSFPAHMTNPTQEIPPDKMLQDPNRLQWVKFRVKVCLMPYLLLIDFVWQWLSIHYWISWIVICNAMVMTVMEYFYAWTLWRRKQMSTLPKMILQRLFDMFCVVLLWPLIPQFICDFNFYCGLFFSSIIYISFRKPIFKLAQQ